MKLLKLNLKAIGPFSGVVLDLAAGREGLHLIYGPQRGGQDLCTAGDHAFIIRFPSPFGRQLCSSQRATSRRRTAAAQHWRRAGDYAAAGGEVTLLRGSDDSLVVAEGWQRRFLGDLTQESFQSLFGIDHERLSQAGEEIRTGKGTLGEMLFAAGAGLAGLCRAQQTLQQSLDDLFKPRAQKSRINKALTELENSQKELKRQQLTIEEWQERDSSYREASAGAERLREQLRKDRIEHARLKRVMSAIPLIAPSPAS